MSDIVVSAVAPNMVEIIWPNITKFIELAIEYSHGELTNEIIKSRVLDQAMILVLIHKGDEVIAALTIEKREFDTGKNVMNITTAGGEAIHLWIDQVSDVLESIAREHNCSHIYIVGRKGWVKMLSDKGYQAIHTVLCKRIGDN